MPLSLPNLDDLRWQDLVDEGVSLIPGSAPEWTNHNASDPGITLIELLAYASERLIYRLNRVSDANVRQFLRLINGRKPTKSLAEEKRATLHELRRTKRAVTATDFELLAEAVGRPETCPVSRAKCVARRNLEFEASDAQYAEAPGHVSVVILPKEGAHPVRSLLEQVADQLEPARLLTTRVHVVPPRYVRIRVRLKLVALPGVFTEGLREQAVHRLGEFLDPRKGGADGKGWPFGRDVYLSELYQVLGEVPGVDCVMPRRDAHGVLMDELEVEPSYKDRLIRNDSGGLDGIRLCEDELVEADLEKESIVVAHAFSR